MKRLWINIKDFFESRYIPEPNSGCWIWIGGDNGIGYGKLDSSLKKLGLTNED